LMGRVHHAPSTTTFDGNESTRPKVKHRDVMCLL
jgi:hypothetical protein